MNDDTIFDVWKGEKCKTKVEMYKKKDEMYKICGIHKERIKDTVKTMRCKKMYKGKNT